MDASCEEVSIKLEDFRGAPVEAKFLIDRPHDYIQSRIRTGHEFYERSLLNFLSRITKPEPLFIDIGANIGNHSIYFALQRRAQVLAFEPNRDNYERLKRNVQASGVSSHVRTWNAAVGSKSATVVSSGDNEANSGGFTVVECTPSTANAVPQLVLDALEGLRVEASRDTIIKIDVEGAEIDVLKGMIQLARAHDLIISIEIQNDKNAVLARNLLSPIGYMNVGSFFKQATFVLVRHSRVASIVSELASQSWDEVRAHVDYCRVCEELAVLKRRMSSTPLVEVEPKPEREGRG